jgi:hypothetical protein
MTALPSEITVAEFGGGEVCYRLPRRPSGLVRFGGLLGMAMGAFFASWPLLGLAFLRSAGPPLDGPRRSLAVPILFVFEPICFSLGGLLVFRGLLGLAGHTEIVVREGSLYSIDRWGFLRWTRRRPLEKLRGFRLENRGGRPGVEERTEDWPTLKADFGDGKSLMVCCGYPREWVLPLAEDLALKCRRQMSRYSATLTAPIPLPYVSEESATVRDRARQPAHSTAILERQADGFTITIPPVGLRRSCKGFFFAWCLIWNIFLVVFVPLFLPAAFRGEVKWEGTKEIVSPLFACLFMTPFLLVGVGSALAFSYRVRRSASIVVAGDTLKIVETTLFGTRQREWAARDLAGIRVISESSPDSEGGTRWTTTLNVHPKEGETYRYLSYRDKAELEWIATLLRPALRLR